MQYVDIRLIAPLSSIDGLVAVDFAENEPDLEVATYTVSLAAERTLSSMVHSGADADSFTLTDTGNPRTLSFLASPNFEAAADADADQFRGTVESLDSTVYNVKIFFKTAPDFEAPTDVGDAAGNNIYALTLSVMDSGGAATDTFNVTVTVTDVPENTAGEEDPGTVVIEGRAVVGSELTATVSDPDGGEMVTARSWQISPPPPATENFVEVGTVATYTPLLANLGDLLRVSVTYTDAQGTETETVISEPVTIRPADKPLRPSARLVEDTGLLGDRITRNGAVQVQNVVMGATWEYTTGATNTDGNLIWLPNPGTGDTFTLSEGVYYL